MNLKHVGFRYMELIAPKVGVLVNGIKLFSASCILWGVLQLTSQNTYSKLRVIGERITKQIGLKSEQRKEWTNRKNGIMINPKESRKKEMKKQKMGQLENSGKIADLNSTI